ncbi:unnamed protein product, partial [Adineta steineri]
KVLFLHVRSRICAALIASAIFKKYASLSHSVDMTDKFQLQVLEFATYAAISLDKCYKCNDERACELLLRQLSIFGYGNGTVTLLTIYSTGVNSVPSSISIKDLNKDNYLDIVITDYNSNEILVLIGSNEGNFSKLNSYSLGYNAGQESVAIADINNDSLYDLIVANYGTNYVEILLQTC